MRRSTRIGGFVLGVALGAAAFWAMTRPARASRGAPGLVVRSKTAGADAGLREGDEDRAMALALASTTPAERQRILELMRYTTARLEARLSPLGTDFGEDDGDAVEQFRRVMVAYAPSFSAARAFERGAWESSDLSVQVVSSCNETVLGAEDVCAPVWLERAEPSPLEERARFLAWSVSRAAIVDLPTREAAHACARALRERTPLEGSAVALVLTRDDLALREVPERREIQDAARLLGRAMAANDIKDTQHLEAFARPTPEGRVASWLDLAPTAVLVVPRLSALARLTGFEEEIQAAPECGKLRWVHSSKRR